MEQPSRMVKKLNERDLKAAAQAHYLCNSVFCGVICGNELDVDRVSIVIVSLWLVKYEPDLSLVVAPEEKCEEWVTRIEAGWMKVSQNEPYNSRA